MENANSCFSVPLQKAQTTESTTARSILFFVKYKVRCGHAFPGTLSISVKPYPIGCACSVKSSGDKGTGGVRAPMLGFGRVWRLVLVSGTNVSRFEFLRW